MSSAQIKLSNFSVHLRHRTPAEFDEEFDVSPLSWMLNEGNGGRLAILVASLVL
jgi:hypothetical protein